MITRHVRPRTTRGALFLFTFAFSAVAWPASGAEIDRIASFSAGESAPCNDSSPDLATQPGGAFLLVWQQSGCPSPPSAWVRAIRFDAAGRALGSLNHPWPGLEPQVAPLPDGGFVVASLDLQVIQPPKVLGINLHRLDGLGRPVGEPVSVVATQSAPNVGVRLAVAQNGAVAVVWQVVSVNPLFPAIVLGRFFNSALEPVTEAFLLSNGPTFPGQFEPEIAFQADGTALALWSGIFQTNGSQIYGRRFDVSGHPLTSVFPVSQVEDRANFVPRVVAGPEGGWWVGWFSDPLPYPPPPGPDPGQTEARVVRLGAGGERLGVERSLESLRLPDAPPALGTDGAGNLLMLGTALDGSIAGRLIERDGAAVSNPFSLSQGVASPYRFPIVADRSPGAFVSAWSGDSFFAPDDSDLFGAIFTPTCLEGKTAACLGPDGRYGVEVAWQIGASSGTARPLPLAGNVATFGLRNAADHDVTVLLSGAGSRDLTFAATTGAALEIRVTDKTTGTVRKFSKPAGRFASGRFPSALPSLSGDAEPSAATFIVPDQESGLAPDPAVGETCVPTSRALCLLGGRFRAELLAGQYPNPALAITRTDKSGAFALPRASETPLVTLTMIDGRASNGKFWVYLGGLSSSGYKVRITDLSTGAAKSYANPVGKLDSRADRTAFQ